MQPDFIFEDILTISDGLIYDSNGNDITENDAKISGLIRFIAFKLNEINESEGN